MTIKYFKRDPNKFCYQDAELIGFTFHQLTILSLESRGSVRWAKCECTCGNKCEKRLGNLLNNGTKSCGCRRNYSDPSKAHQGIIRLYKKNAARNGTPFRLSDKQFIALVVLPCFYCGKPPGSSYGGRKNHGFNGIDRVDNKKGYTVKNCVPCCKECNFAKRGFPLEVFLAIVARIAKHQATIRRQKKCPKK